jgi:O-antigen ligase
MHLTLTAARNRLLEAGCWSVLLCLAAVPINKPLVNIFIFFALLCALFGARTQERWLAALRQPVVIGCFAWFAVLAMSALHAPSGVERWHTLSSYKALLYPAIVAALFETQRWRERGQLAFGAATAIVLLLSWGQFAGIVPQREIVQTFESYRHTVFKDYTQQGIQFLLLAAMALSFAQRPVTVLQRRLLWIVAIAAFINVIFLLQSRTSYLIVAPLLVYWTWRLLHAHRGGWRRMTAGVLVLAALGTAAAFTPRVQQRMAQAEQDLQLYSSKREATSMGIRLELWQRTLPIVASAPLFGHGLGQWMHEYHLEVDGLPDYAAFVMGHPHQEALLIIAEEGLLGFALFAVLLIALARYIRRIESPQREFYASLLLIYVTAGLANCILADFSHRHTFMMLLACIPFLSPAKTGSAAASKAKS